MRSLQIKNLTKSFGKTKVLSGIDIALESGEFLVLVGPSGCGKSTLLNIIAGLEAPSSGEILLDEKDITKVAPKNRGLAMVFQTYALYPNMTVKQNIEFGLKLSNISKAEIKKRVQESAQMLQITELLGRKPSQLSGGQRQRVAIARSISREPNMYLFDEPLSNLDAELRVRMRTEIKKLHKKVNKTIIYVTHDQIEAMTLADKIAVLHKGKVQQFGSPKDVYDDPSNLFTAGFIGSPSMNFIPAVIEQKDDVFFVRLRALNSKENIIYLLDDYADLKNYVDKEVFCAIRPEYIQNGFRNKSVDELREITLRVNFMEFTGSDAFVFSTINGVECLARVSTNTFLEEQEEITLKIWVKKILFFDKDTQERIR